jgi:hypothetical protein
MKRNIWLFLLSPLLVLTGVPANADLINFTDLLSSTWTLQNVNSGPLLDASGNPILLLDANNHPILDAFGNPIPLLDINSNGTASLSGGSATVTGSDVNTADQFGVPTGGPLFNSNFTGGFDPALLGVDGLSGDGTGTDPYGNPLGTFTQFSTVISGATPGVTLQTDGTSSGDLTFNWNYTTLDGGSFYDPAGYFQCAPVPRTGFPSGGCALFPLTMSYDSFAGFVPSPSEGVPGGSGAALDPTTGAVIYAFNLDGTVNTAFNPPTPCVSAIGMPPCAGYAETGTATVTLLAGDTFGAYVLSLDNANGAGTVTFSSPTPEPASFLLIGGGLLALGVAGRKKTRRRRQEENTTVV